MCENRLIAYMDKRKLSDLFLEYVLIVIEPAIGKHGGYYIISWLTVSTDEFDFKYTVCQIMDRNSFNSKEALKLLS